MNSDASSIYDALMALEDFSRLSSKKMIEGIAKLVDASGDLGRDEGLIRALEWCDNAEQQGLSDARATLVEYYRANAWGHRKQIKNRDQSSVWAWEQPELQNQVWHLRHAVAHAGFESLPPLQRCQILTNLGGQLSTVGRIFEAIEIWGRAIAINPRFAMALGNRGYGLERCAESLYDPGHQCMYLWFAHDDLSDALSSQAKWDSPFYEKARGFFQELKSRIETYGNISKLKKATSLEKHSLGRSKNEQLYRRWCLENRLFLNPLNDLGPYPIAGRDILSLPNFTTPINEPPKLVGFFSQIKQEFVSARWLFYDGTHSTGVHFSDRDVLLYNTLDHSCYCLAVEKMKAAYRMVYSLFDKMAFFLNEYMRLGISPNSVYFRSIWYENNDARRRVLRKEFLGAENWPLRGLFWLSKDLFDDHFRDVMEPDAQALNEIRNRAEHSYLKVHEFIGPELESAGFSGVWDDRLAYSVGRRELKAKTLRLLKLVRAAFLYMSLAMHREESSRVERGDPVKTMSMALHVLPDSQKR